MTRLQHVLPALALLTAPAFAACDGFEKENAGVVESAGDDAQAPCDEEHLDEARPCDDGGSEFCHLGDDGEPAWGACISEPACVPGEGVDGCNECMLDGEGTPFWVDVCGGDDESSTPLVLSFGGAPVEYGAAGHRFDLGPQCAATDWPTAATPWLALDRDRSGAIDGGHELFGSATRLRGGGTAENGFLALAELDADGDGRLTPADPAFADLVVWTDGDGDRRSTGFELQSTNSLGLVAIELGYASDRRCDVRGNCEVERASFRYTDALGREATGEVIDVHLACQ